METLIIDYEIPFAKYFLLRNKRQNTVYYISIVKNDHFFDGL